MIYLDYAATTPMDGEVLAAMSPYFTEKFGNPDSLHSFGRKAAFAVTSARDEVAKILGVKPNEVYFTSGGTEGDNWAIKGLTALSGKKKFAISAIEHHAVSAAADQLEKLGYEKILLPVDEAGMVRISEAERLIDSDVGLVSVMAVNNETGVRQPVEELSEIARKRGAFFHSDCVQASCCLDLKKLCALCDSITLSAHKFYGPKGVGVLVVKNKIFLPPLIAGGEQERGLRGGTSNVPAIVGLAHALKNAQNHLSENNRRAEELRSYFEGELTKRFPSAVKIDGKNRVPFLSHVTFDCDGAESLVNRLDLKGIAVSSGAACASHSPLPSHVMLAMGRSEKEARRGVRFSFGKNTTMDEVKEVLNALSELLGQGG